MILRRTSLLLISVLALSGCFDQLSGSGTLAESGLYLTPADFIGADSAKNILTGVQIQWTPVNTGKNLIGYHIYRYEASAPILIASVAPTISSFVDGNVVSGSKYQYLVRAVDPSNQEDSNQKKVSSIAWSGPISVFSSSNGSITVTFDPKLQGVFLKLFLTGEGRPRTAVALLNTPAQLATGSATLSSWDDGTNLKPGSQYTVHAELFENGGSIADGNSSEYAVSTLSYGFDAAVNGAPGWNNVASVRAFGRSPGTQGSAVDNGISGTAKFIPTDLAQVDLGFLPFTLPSGFPKTLYRYVILRAGEDVDLNTASGTLTNCPSPYNSTVSFSVCIVKDNIDPAADLQDGLIVAHDTTVWATNAPTNQKPPRYRYTMAIKHLDSAGAITGYIEALPLARTTALSVLVPIPPDNMVLVNREAVNFETCAIQKAVTADPLNFNRCVSYEVGSSPFNAGPGGSPLGLASGYYDFGYNLFVDRYPLACNVSNSVEEAAAGWTTSTSNANSDGNVLFAALTTGASANLRMSNCLYSNGTTWTDMATVASTAGSLAPNIFKSALSNSPSSGNGFAQRPKFSYPLWDSSTANQACGAFSESGYGSKRIPRMREYRALSAPPFSKRLADSQIIDLYYSPAIAATTTNVGASWNTGGCVSGDVASSPHWPTPPFSITTAFSPSNTNGLSYSSSAAPPNFFIGASGDSDCVSRYGVSDVFETASLQTTYFNLLSVNSAWYPLSDEFLWTDTVSSTVGTLRGLTSPLDSGNMDAAVDIASGLLTGYMMNVTAANHTTTSPNRFDISLGLPVLSTQQGTNAYGQTRATTDNYGQSILAIFPSGTSNGYFGRGTARWSTSFQDGKSYNSRVRCVLPAD